MIKNILFGGLGGEIFKTTYPSERKNIVMDPWGSRPGNPIEAWVYKKITETISEVFFDDKSKQSGSITKEDVERISRLIADGRNQGVEELEIKISKDFGVKLEAAATLPFEVPVNAKALLCKQDNGEYLIKVKYLPPASIDGLRDLHELHKQGALSDEEYAEAKKRVIQRL